MHENFPDWYRTAAVTVAEGVLQKRWSGVEALSKKPSPSLIVGLAKLLVLPASADAPIPSSFQEAFREADQTFTVAGNRHELRVLAGATLRLVIEEDSKLATLAALSVTAGSFGPRGDSSPSTDHVQAANEWLEARSVRTREKGLDDLSMTTLTRKRAADVLQDPVFTQSLVALKEPLLTMFAELIAATNSNQKAAETLARALRYTEEELGMLWWIQGEYSGSMRASFKKVGATAGALVFPTDLAGLTISAPGPSTITGLVAKSLLVAGTKNTVPQSSVSDVVNGVPRDWRHEVVHTLVPEDAALLCPIHLALSHSLLTDGSSDWQPVYRKACDMPLDEPFALLAIGLQVYRERMLILSIRQVEK